MRKLLIMSAAAAIFTSGQVIADEVEHNGFYIGGSLGVVEHVLDDDGVQEIDGSSTTFGLEAGYYFNEFWKLGVNYNDFGKAKLYSYTDGFGSTIKISTDGSAMGLFVGYDSSRIKEEWAFGARLGLSNMSADLIVDDSMLGSGKASDSRVNIFGGISVAYNFTYYTQLKFTADWYVFSPKFGEGAKFDMQYSPYAISVVHQF